MKTNVFKYFSLGTIMAASLAACGGESGDGSIQRGNPQNVAYKDVEFVSPTNGQVGVCPLLTLQIKIAGLENCNLDLNNALRVYQDGQDPFASTIRFAGGLDPRPLPAENKCLLTGTVSQQLQLGNVYHVRVFSNMVTGADLLPDTLTFTTLAQGASQSACQQGSFQVSDVNGTVPGSSSDLILSNILDFGTVRPDFTVDVSPEATQLFGSTFANLFLSFFQQSFVPNNYRYDNSPSALHTQKVVFSQPVRENALSNIMVFKIMGVNGLVPDLLQVGLWMERRSANEYWIHPWDSEANNGQGGDTGWDYNQRYLLLIKRSLVSTNGVNMQNSVIRMFKTGN